MDPDPPAPRKRRFQPKPPPANRKPTVTLVGRDAGDGAGGETPQSLETLMRRRSVLEKKYAKKNAAKPEEPALDSTKSPDVSMADPSGSKKKEYKEPWDYNGNYPVTLPWRIPPAGDPEILDEEEFGEPKEYDETAIPDAVELGLTDQENQPKMFFFQFPPQLPNYNSPSSNESGKSEPGGYMGKMLVHKSGAVKLKLGDVVFDVGPGMDRSCAENVVAVDFDGGEMCEVGVLEKHAVVSADIDRLLEEEELKMRRRGK
ncbi:uncharacterized protein LOC127259285 isoform X2 [Andrographis paniculata]|uniref:uncharacterized protein LOC127259285 isoform X2 n=1 Tax=Andrographis paniculata TaxID=175694 RepID=UPI0021E8CA24|nr:uncharacterized protein LOC127259285 isoform X2 [Andrographis paniculata]